MQILLALFSAIFVIVVSYGYYHLLTDFGWGIGLLGGLLIAVFAWSLARVAGTSDGGIRGNWILIIPLFLISAAGVYNTMMVYLEGGQVLADTAASSEQRFGLIEDVADTQLDAAGIKKRINRINSYRDALFSEIANPLNCGQGPVARRLIAQLQGELSDFRALSSPTRDCSHNESVIQDYRGKIASLIARSPWNDAELNSIASEAKQDREKLAALQGELARSYSPGRIHEMTGIFEGLQSEYQDLRYRLAKKSNVADIPPALDIVGAQSLGNVYKLPALFFSRLGVASTYVYLLMALGFDLLLVYLFQLTARNRVRRHAIAGAIAGAW